ncbi:MAG TPA: class D beta-lactamase [Myxococcales bacterium]|nr:class D beta-lactamase [Myxococcales bacterium]
MIAVLLACTVIADAGTGKVLRQDGVCDQQVTPASTFKIAISLMGYDSGYLTGEHLPLLRYRIGDPDWDSSWKLPTDPASWIKSSVVWYSQRVTEWLGEARFRQYVQAFHYGNEDVIGESALQSAWLSSTLKISPLQQIQFLQKLVNGKLPVSAKAVEMTARLTAAGNFNGWEVHGKTGSGFPAKPAGGLDTAHAYGWYVGWAVKAGRTIVFAYLIQDEKQLEPRAGLRAREEFLRQFSSLAL